ncbi:DUF2867 domain-containing protein [Hymenobacter fastidiosus]|uniref:DUF2867 domain-containing protein n=1 Tax=Hymenobacter fastidiosus TaxID=486264 RepID=A0ABP7SGB7_9BACT
MNSPTVTAVGIPATSQIAAGFSSVDYADAYQLPLLAQHPVAAPAVAQLLFGQGPGWVRHLLRLRHWLVRPLGLTTFPATPLSPDQPLVPGGRLGLFQVFSVADQEVVLGLNDRHLDFRVSVWVPPTPPRRAVVTTVVHFHNRVGRLYFAVIRPFHHLVVKALLRHALRKPAAGQLAEKPEAGIFRPR